MARTPLARLVVVTFVLRAAAAALAQPGTSSDGSRSVTSPTMPPSNTAYPRSPEQVMASLNRAMTWYRHQAPGADR